MEVINYPKTFPNTLIIGNVSLGGFRDIYDYDESKLNKLFAATSNDQAINITGLARPRKLVPKDIQCETFSAYAFNCTMHAARIYNSRRNAPPMPSKMSDWCMAIKSLTDCAVEWNSQCKEVTDSHFNEESIRGHMHVVTNICDDDKFLMRYDDLPECIDSTADYWEYCYNVFKVAVDQHKNTSHEWTHYEVHFYMCCARARFRRCTLDTLFKRPTNCSHEQAITLQRFSVIVSEGDVYQNCDFHMMYADCPGGDPRPPGAVFRTVSRRLADNCAVIITSGKLCIFCTLLYVVALLNIFS